MAPISSLIQNLNTVTSFPAGNFEDTAIIIPETRDAVQKTISYGDLDRKISKCQRELAHMGIAKGSRVAVVLPNGLEFATTFFACARQRAVMAPLNPQSKREELEEMLKMIKPAVLVAGAHLPTVKNEAESAARTLHIRVARWTTSVLVDEMELVLDTSALAVSNRAFEYPSFDGAMPGDSVLRLCTSGTTGRPKSVELSHENLLTAVRIIAAAHHLAPADRCIIITPLFHVAGIGACLLPTLLTGGTAVIPASVPARFWDVCREHRITWYHAVPTLHRALLATPRPATMPALRFVRCGGSDLDADLLRAVEDCTGAPLLEIYGMTETAPGVFCNRIDGPAGQPGLFPVPEAVETRILRRAPGRPLRLTVQVGVEGEVCVRGRSVMAAYVDDARANADAFLGGGFFRTGDLGVLLPGGFLRLTGRIKEVINKGGEKIGPAKVEAAARAHGAVLEAACFRVKDAIYGEDVGTWWNTVFEEES